jgi:hypothetical protein
MVTISGRAVKDACVPRSPSLDNASPRKKVISLPSAVGKPDLCVHVVERAVSMSVIDRTLDGMHSPYCASGKKQDLLVKSLCELVHKRIGTPRR